jgi:DNA-binding CsgD family transcriptional regulator
VAFEQGRYDDASRYAEASLSTTSHTDGIPGVTARCALGRVRVRRGDPGGSSVLDDVIAIGDEHLFQYVWNAYCGQAEHAWLTGRLDDGDDGHLRHAFDRAMATDSPWARGEVGFWMWRAGFIDEPPDGAAEPFALQMSGEWRVAAERWGSIGCPYEQAMALADGDDDAALAAIEILDGLGATPAARMLRGSLRERGVRGVPRGPSRTTRLHPAGLTERQHEVLGLMAEGLSNAEMADRLYVSRKTVEHHVSAVLTKLDADTRLRAVAIARDRGFLETSG